MKYFDFAYARKALSLTRETATVTSLSVDFLKDLNMH